MIRLHRRDKSVIGGKEGSESHANLFGRLNAGNVGCEGEVGGLTAEFNMDGQDGQDGMWIRIILSIL